VERQLEDLACNFIVDKSIEAMLVQLWPDFHKKLFLVDALAGQRPPGLFALVDDVCNIPSGSVTKLMDKLKAIFQVHEYISFGEGIDQICVRHMLATDADKARKHRL
jgi:hypothetical protein